MTSENEIVISREFEYPLELLYTAWTEPGQIERWCWPAGFSTVAVDMDLRPGGTWNYVIKGPNGDDHSLHGTYLNVDPAERIVSTREFGRGSGDEEIAAQLPRNVVITTLFEAVGSGSRLTLRIAHPTIEDRQKHIDMGAVSGWEAALDRLAQHLAELHN